MHNFFSVESNLYSLNANYIYELVFKSVASEYMRKINPPQMRYAYIVMNNKGRQLLIYIRWYNIRVKQFCTNW